MAQNVNYNKVYMQHSTPTKDQYETTVVILINMGGVNLIFGL